MCIRDSNVAEGAVQTAEVSNAIWKSYTGIYVLGYGCLLYTSKRPLDEGVRLMVAHIDSPRRDLKPNPLYEDSDIALFKTHYYGGIRKYQWGMLGFHPS